MAPDSIFFHQEPWLKLCALSQEGYNELAGFGISAADDPLEIEDFVLVKHFATAATFEFCPDAMGKHMEDMAARGISPDRCLKIYIHTHPHESPTPSQTDWNEFEDFSENSDFTVMFIMARGGACHCTLRLRMLEDHHPCGWRSVWVDKLLEPRIRNWPGFKSVYTKLGHVPASVLAQLPFAAWTAEYDTCALKKPHGYYQGYAGGGNSAHSGWLGHTKSNGPADRVKAKKQKKNQTNQVCWDYEDAVRDINPLLPSPEVNKHYARLRDRASTEAQAKAWWARRQNALQILDVDDHAKDKLAEHIEKDMLDDDKKKRSEAWKILLSRTKNDIGIAQLVWQWVQDNAAMGVDYQDCPADEEDDEDFDVVTGLSWNELEILIATPGLCERGVQIILEEDGGTLWYGTKQNPVIATYKIASRYNLTEEERKVFESITFEYEAAAIVAWLEDRLCAANAAKSLLAQGEQLLGADMATTPASTDVDPNKPAAGEPFHPQMPGDGGGPLGEDFHN